MKGGSTPCRAGPAGTFQMVSRKSPIYIDNIRQLRSDILALEKEHSKRSKLWSMLKNSARNSPFSFGWFVPFVALITQEEQDIENARKIMRAYIEKFDIMSLNSGLQFHFWCFAFPHAKMSLYFQWLCTLNAFDKAEERHISEELVKYHFVNYYFGLLTKPEPECVDNQALSLAYSSAFVGYLFSQGDHPSEMARLMYRDGLRRLPGIIASMPESGYSGEGSTYMDRVNGPAIPFSIEFLEMVTGRQELLYHTFEPGSCKPANILEVIARQWMPGGLLLPWDHYGYQYGVRSTIAYAARKTGRAIFYDILENRCNLAYDVSIGWAFDDLVWTLIWWPDQPPEPARASEKSWYHPEVGGILESEDSNTYVAQFWDKSTPVYPSRSHVNPNMILFNGYRIPLSADGISYGDKCKRFHFADTYRQVSNHAIGEPTIYNFGAGCAGAHSVILLDGWEGMRAMDEYPQTAESCADLSQSCVYADVYPIYREKWPDVQAVKRKTTLLQDRMILVEDLVQSGRAHTVASRFFLRPAQRRTKYGVKIETSEGVTLNLVDLLGHTQISTEYVPDYPTKPDGGSLLVDFISRGTQERRLFAAFISRTRKTHQMLDGFRCIPDPDMTLVRETALSALACSPLNLPMQLPPYMEASLPVYKRWWYAKRISKQPGSMYLILPCGMQNPRLWINHVEIEIPVAEKSGNLMHKHIKIPEEFENHREIDILFRTDVVTSHYEDGANGSVNLNGGIAVAYPCQEEEITGYSYDGEHRSVQTNMDEYISNYRLMEG